VTVRNAIAVSDCSSGIRLSLFLVSLRNCSTATKKTTDKGRVGRLTRFKSPRKTDEENGCEVFWST